VIEYLLVGALIYRKPLSSIAYLLKLRDEIIVRLDRSRYGNVVGLVKVRSASDGRLGSRV
jgi:hypothetical protein